MYFGHFAAAAAIKAKEKETPVLPILIGTVLLDIFDGVFILIGIDKVSPNLNAVPYLYYDMTFIDWDHSLLAAVFWSLVWGAVFWKNKRTAVIASLSVFSHFLLDWPMHNNDLALYPFSDIHFGLGLWGNFGTWSWLMEIAFAAALLYYSFSKSREAGVNLLWPSVFILSLSIQLSPWLSPMKFAASLPEPYTARIHGALTLLGFIIPSIILLWLYKKAEIEKNHNAG